MKNLSNQPAFQNSVSHPGLHSRSVDKAARLNASSCWIFHTLPAWQSCCESQTRAPGPRLGEPQHGWIQI